MVSQEIDTNWKRVNGVVIQGHQTASGVSPKAQFREGTIYFQKFKFKELGLNLDFCFNGTINLSIAPSEVVLHDTRLQFHDVLWHPEHRAEHFSMSPCRILFEGRSTDAFVYYPHPETKPNCFHPRTTVELIAPFIQGVTYGSRLELQVLSNEIEIVTA